MESAVLNVTVTPKMETKSPDTIANNVILKAEDFCASFGSNQVLKKVNMAITRNHVVAVLGPSGCGKTTFVRCINRMHELAPDATVEGKMIYNGDDVYKMNPVVLRSHIGMVFQRPNPFPSMSTYENVIAGYIFNEIKLTKAQKDEVVETSLKSASLWDEVKDILHKKGTSLSGGQQQRLCIARALAMKPKMLLLDEPTAALDPISTLKIEELLVTLKETYTIVIVTHNIQQAGRVSDKAAFFYLGELIEYDDTKNMFTNPKEERTQNYITGRFG
jgi:phosphate transport system ATP-binding protein